MTQAYDYNKAWRQKHPSTRYAGKKRNYVATRDTAHNARQPWTEAEDRLVLSSPLTDRALGAEIGRSVQAIQVRRSKLKALSAQTDEIEEAS